MDADQPLAGTLRYRYSFLCTARVRAILDNHAHLNPRKPDMPQFSAWRDAFVQHAAECRSPRCPGPLLAAGIDLVGSGGSVERTLYEPFENWESVPGVFRPPLLDPQLLDQLLRRMCRELAPVPEDLRLRRLSCLRLRLSVWGVSLRPVRSLGEVARQFAQTNRSWRHLPGVRPAINARLLSRHLPARLFAVNAVRDCLSSVLLCPEPVPSLARAANLTALSAFALRSMLFGHPNIAAPAYLVARLVSCGLLPLGTRGDGSGAAVLVYKPPGWPKCGLS